MRKKGWTLEEALAWIREHQPRYMKHGWYIALGGGVLNRGASDEDLDLVLMPRTQDSQLHDALALIETTDSLCLKEETLITGFFHLRCQYDDQQRGTEQIIELVVVTVP